MWDKQMVVPVLVELGEPVYQQREDDKDHQKRAAKFPQHDRPELPLKVVSWTTKGDQGEKTQFPSFRACEWPASLLGPCDNRVRVDVSAVHIGESKPQRYKQS